MTRLVDSALIIAVPQAEHLVAPFRTSYDPSASLGAPAHITLLYPFRALTAITDSVLDELRVLFAAHPAFHFALTGPERFPDLLYLAPDPRAPFDRLTAELANQYPDTPPYGGAIADPIPHLTVGYAVDPQLSRLAADFTLVASSLLPIVCCADSVDLLVNQEGRWRTHSRFELGGPAA